MKLLTMNAASCLLKAIRLCTLAILILSLNRARAADSPQLPASTNEVKSASFEGSFDGERARLVFQANLAGQSGTRDSVIHATNLRESLHVQRDRIGIEATLRIEVLQGIAREVVLPMQGDGVVTRVVSEEVEDWSLRQRSETNRFLVLRLKPTEKPRTRFQAVIQAETVLKELPSTVAPLVFSGEPAVLTEGLLAIHGPLELEASTQGSTGLVRMEPADVPAELRRAGASGFPLQAFRYQGLTPQLRLRVAFADPESRGVAITDFSLASTLSEDEAAFELRAVARVRNPAGGRAELLRGVALTAMEAGPGVKMQIIDGRLIAVFAKDGEYPLLLKFNAAVRQVEGWSSIDFGVVPGTLQPWILRGLRADTQFKFEGGSKPERRGEEFHVHVPAGGAVKASWKQARAEAEGRLFYAAKGLSLMTVSPGLLRQSTGIDLKIMQGEMTEWVCVLNGPGEVTRVQGAKVLSWAVEGDGGGSERRLRVRFNEPQRDQVSLAIQAQQPLGAFPLPLQPLFLDPVGASRFGGFVRLSSEGAVRLEVTQARGLSQVSPDQIPVSDLLKSAPPTSGSTFAYRFSQGGHALAVQADNILPEVSVSGVFVYQAGTNDQSVDADLELDIREAPVRELSLRVPKGFTIASLNAAGIADYSLVDLGEPDAAQLRLTFGAPTAGRALLNVRLERNKPLTESRWALPRIEVIKAKSMRGHVGVLTESGLRASVARTTGLTEVTTSLFPKRIPGLQTAFRITEPSWQLETTIERSPQTIQSEVFHLFSIGEGVAYGSSLMTYVVTGAPVSAFRVDLAPEYANVEFVGKNLRGWQKSTNGYVIQLHSPVSGSYSLLATYERSFKPQGEKLSFAGARPLDASSELGHTAVISAQQFRVQTSTVSTNLTALEPGELPAEYRLLFDAPILAAYRYTSRPFQLELDLQPLSVAETIPQVVDRAGIESKISSEGQVVTEARYLVKSRTQPQLRLRLPAGVELWSATVNGAAVVPVKDQAVTWIPLPQRGDPNTVHDVVVKLATKVGQTTRFTLAAPVVLAPILLTEWRLVPEAGRQLQYLGGSVSAPLGAGPQSAFRTVWQALRNPTTSSAGIGLLGMAGGASIAIAAVWLALRPRSSGGRFIHWLGGLGLGVGAMAFVAGLLLLTRSVYSFSPAAPESLSFTAPVQQEGAVMELTLSSRPASRSVFREWAQAWPWALALMAWGSVLAYVPALRRVGWAGVWSLAIWAALAQPHGGVATCGLLGLFALTELWTPCWRAWRRCAPVSSEPTPPSMGSAPGLVTLAVLLSFAPAAQGQQAAALKAVNAPIQPLRARAQAESVQQELRVEDDFVMGTARIRWRAEQGQLLELLRDPAVVTKLDAPGGGVRLVRVPSSEFSGQLLVADRSGELDLTVQFQTRVQTRQGERGFAAAIPPGLVNRSRVILPGAFDVACAQAAAIRRLPSTADGLAFFELVLTPSAEAWISWKPRSRDVKRETAVYYAEWTQAFAPAAGVVEGVHLAQIRPAQGELSELQIEAPAGVTVTDVSAAALSTWRFDPDTRRLRLSLMPAQSKPFDVRIQSQVAAGALPFERTMGLMRLLGSAAEVGLAAVASGPEVQIDSVTPTGLTPINLEDFPSSALSGFSGQGTGVTARRAFRYGASEGRLSIKAAAVEPDVRVETLQTLSIGEDRLVLAANLTVEITRAGVFRLSFVLPPGLEVESITGPVLSHWTELKSGADRLITLHLKGRTEGRTSFALTLSGAGVKPVQGWVAPNLQVREAAKQRGRLILVPEQGLRPQVSIRDGVTQLDPLREGIRQKGALVFGLLQSDWKIAVDLEQVDSWIQVASLQHVELAEAQLKTVCNLQYDIENAGLKRLRVRLPAAAEGVRFRGEQIADFTAEPAAVGGAFREWDIKLQRRTIGRYVLQAAYSLPLADSAAAVSIVGVLARDASLHRGFLTVRGGGRREIVVDTLPATLQASDWQSIPRSLHQDAAVANSTLAFRVVEPDFQLGLRLARHQAAKLLPARVNQVELTSVVADNAAMLTHVRVRLAPGDKRLLPVKLPASTHFWFASVNQNSSWLWQDAGQVLIPLEPPNQPGGATEVEFFYSSSAGAVRGSELALSLAGPQFDLPLENIGWRVFLGERWRVLGKTTGSLRLVESAPGGSVAAGDLESYARGEKQVRVTQSKQAENWMSVANSSLMNGDPEQARRAFKNALELSRHDDAFNEDARVQLHNLKTQQALVGLNVWQARAGNEGEQLAVAPRGLREGRNLGYTQQEAKQLLDRNPAEENTAQVRLVERLIQQQEAAVSKPASIRASVPEIGRVLHFTRDLEVNPWADLNIRLRARSEQALSGPAKAMLLAIFPATVFLPWLVRKLIGR